MPKTPKAGFDKEQFARAIANIHPADELSAVREEIKILQERADELRVQNRFGSFGLTVLE